MAGWWGLRSTYECRAGNFNFRPAVAEEGIEAEQINEAVEVDFGLESHLEDFIIENWDNLELGNKYALLDNDGDMIAISDYYLVPKIQKE